MKKKFIYVLILGIFILPFKVNAYTSDTNINSLVNETEQLISEMKNIDSLDKKYPIGSIYISTSSTNPSQTLGGTWAAYGQGRMLVGVGSNGTSNYTKSKLTGGNQSITLSLSNLPAHSHTITPKGTVSSTFKGTSVTTSTDGNHNHTMPMAKAVDEAQGYGLALINSDVYTYYYNQVIVTEGGTNLLQAGAHSHSFTPTGTISNNFAGTSSATTSVGSGQAINIVNPYITVYMWERTG